MVTIGELNEEHKRNLKNDIKLRPGQLLKETVRSACDSIARESNSARLAGSLQSIERQISAMVDAADFNEITTKEFDAIKRCHYIVLKELRQLGLLAF
jgi:hypothetical protein